MAQTEQDSGKTYADIWGEAVHSNRHLRVLSMGLAGLVLVARGDHRAAVVGRAAEADCDPRGRGRPRRGAGL